MGYLTVVAEINAKPGKEQEVKEALLKLIAPTHAEPGCVDYVLHVSMENPGQFLFYENWKCQNDLDAHLQKPHLQEFDAKASDWLSEPVKITLWNKV